MEEKKKRIIIISAICILVVVVIALITTMVILRRNVSIDVAGTVDVGGETIEEIDKFIDVIRIEESLATKKNAIEDNLGTDISEEQKNILLEAGVPEEDIPGFKVYSAQELLDIQLIIDEREMQEDINEQDNEGHEESGAVYFHTEQEAEEILKENEGKEESKKNIDPYGRYIVTKSEEYIINKTTKVVFLVKPRDGKYAREILIEGIPIQNILLEDSNLETENIEEQEEETIEENLEEKVETLKESEEEINSKAYLTKVSSLKYKVELEYPEEVIEKEYLFDNGIVEVPNVEQTLQVDQQVQEPIEQENMLSIGTQEIAVETAEQNYIKYKDSFILDENGIISTKYIDKDKEEHEENIIINLIKFSSPICTSTVDQINFSSIDNEDKKTAIYQIAKLDVNVDEMTAEQIKEAEESIKKEEVKQTLIFGEEIVSNTIDYALLENGIYVVRFRIGANNQKNITDSEIIEISFHKTNGDVSDLTEVEQEGNFRLRYVSINGYTLSESQLNELLDRGEVSIDINNSISRVTISAEAEDPETVVNGADTMPVEPTKKSLTIVSKGKTKKVYINLKRKSTSGSSNGGSGGSSSSGGNSSSAGNTTTHTHSYSAWVNNGDGGEIKRCSCGASETRKHTLLTSTKAQATCTQAEVRLIRCVNGCGYWGEESGRAASGHSYSAATCTQAAKCSVCGATTGDAIRHSYSAATCTQAAKCSVCGATTGDAIRHSYLAATCTSPKTCSRTGCGATTGDALGHDLSNETCTSAKKCKRAECTHTEGKALGHDYTSQTATEDYLKLAATCTSDAQYYKSCSRCKASSKDNSNEYFTKLNSALRHTGGMATCQSAKICTRCYKPYGEKGNHNYTTWYNSAGLISNGHIKTMGTCYKKCVNCPSKQTHTVSYQVNTSGVSALYCSICKWAF